MSGPPNNESSDTATSDTATSDDERSAPTDRPSVAGRVTESFSTLIRDRAMLAVLATVLVASAMLTMRLLTIRTTSTAPRFVTGDWLLADLGTNLPAAVIVGLAVAVIGAVVAADGHRWGNGVLFGAATSLIGLGALVLGSVERPVQAVRLSADLPSAQSYSTTIIRPAGWVAAAMLVVVAGILAALVHRRLDRDADESYDRRGALVAIALVVLAAAGTAIPTAGSSFLDNLDPSPGFPLLFLIGRIVQVAAMVAAVVIGLWARNASGIGIAAGALVVPAWLVISALFDFGGSPASLGGRNPGVIAPVVPTTVTTVAMLGAVAMLVTLAMVARDRQTRRFLDAVSDARA